LHIHIFYDNFRDKQECTCCVCDKRFNLTSAIPVWSLQCYISNMGGGGGRGSIDFSGYHYSFAGCGLPIMQSNYNFIKQ
jgi:hypothetical protein